jgi:hypothetical protein
MFRKPVGYRGSEPVARSTLPTQQWSSQRGAATAKRLGGIAVGVAGGLGGQACYDVNVRPRVQGNIDKPALMNHVIPVAAGAVSAEAAYLLVLALVAGGKRLFRGSVAERPQQQQVTPQEPFITERVTPLPTPVQSVHSLEQPGASMQGIYGAPTEILGERTLEDAQVPDPTLNLTVADLEFIGAGGTGVAAESSSGLSTELTRVVIMPNQRKLARAREWLKREVSQILKDHPSAQQTGGSHPQRIGPYKVIRYIGGGGMKDVYLAYDKKLGKNVTLHVPRGMDDPKKRGRFVQEVKTLWRVKHPNIMDIYFSELEGNNPYFVGEYIDGIDLGDFILHKGRLHPNQALAIYYSAIQGLKAAYEQGAIHRDLKPDNIMLTREGVVKLIDFGLGKVTQTEADIRELAAAGQDRGELTSYGTLMGTPTYWPPDMVKLAGGSKDMDFRGDIYSLGLILWVMLKGGPPRTFPGDERAAALSFINYALDDNVPVFPDLTTIGLVPNLEELLRRTTIKDPDYRLCDHDGILRSVLPLLV